MHRDQVVPLIGIPSHTFDLIVNSYRRQNYQNHKLQSKKRFEYLISNISDLSIPFSVVPPASRFPASLSSPQKVTRKQTAKSKLALEISHVRNIKLTYGNIGSWSTFLTNIIWLLHIQAVIPRIDADRWSHKHALTVACHIYLWLSHP